jgi:hypothetical protein
MLVWLAFVSELSVPRIHHACDMRYKLAIVWMGQQPLEHATRAPGAAVSLSPILRVLPILRSMFVDVLCLHSVVQCPGNNLLPDRCIYGNYRGPDPTFTRKCVSPITNQTQWYERTPRSRAQGRAGEGRMEKRMQPRRSDTAASLMCPCRIALSRLLLTS